MYQLLLLLQASSASVSTANTLAVPTTCALYFDFRLHPHGTSHAFFGSINKDGSITQRGDLGLQDDPKGQLTISTDGLWFAFTGNDNRTAGKGFGCCSKLAVVTVEMATGQHSTQPFHRGKFPFGESAQIENVKCGLKGCGFMQIGGYMVRSNKLVAWVERLLPNPPPRTAVGDPPSAYLGWELVEFDVSTGNATGIRPFRLDSNNATGPEPLGEGSVSFDQVNQRMWFSCYPNSQNNNREGVCYVPTNQSPDEAPVTSMVSGTGMEYTITSIAWSLALKAAVVVAQKVSKNQGDVDTKVFLADSNAGAGAGVGAGATGASWPLIADLGQGGQNLNQAQITPDGKYLMVATTTGPGDYPAQHLVTIDLVAKQVVNTVDVANNKEIVILDPVPC